MHHFEKDKRYEGIFIGLEFTILFILISAVANLAIKGTLWFVFSSALRFGFGVWILIVVRKVYGKTFKDIINFRGSKAALLAGIGFIVYNKIIKDIKVPFKTKSGDRIDETPVHEALREALANCLIMQIFMVSEV